MPFQGCERVTSDKLETNVLGGQTSAQTSKMSDIAVYLLAAWNNLPS